MWRERRDPRLDGLLWVQSVRYSYQGKILAPKRLLMIDDLHRLRRSQRELLVREMVELRPSIPVWLAERSIALGDELLSQGARQGRDLREYAMDELWGNAKGGGQTLSTFSQILDRRLHIQNVIPAGTFSQYLSDQLVPSDIEKQFHSAVAFFRKESELRNSNMRYKEWFAPGNAISQTPSSRAIEELLSLLILVARDEALRQLALQLEPLSPDELDQRDSSQVVRCRGDHGQ